LLPRPPTPPGIRFRTRAVPVGHVSILPLSPADPLSRTALSCGFRPLLPALRPSLETSAQDSRNSDTKLPTGSALRWWVNPPLTASADFCCLIPPPLGNGSAWQGNRSPRVIRATSIPYACRIYFHIYGYRASNRIAFPPRCGRFVCRCCS